MSHGAAQMTEDEVNAKLDATHARGRKRRTTIDAHLATLSEEKRTIINAANNQMVDDETPYWVIVQQLVKEAKEWADKGDVEPLRQVLMHITGFDLAANLHDSRGKGAPKRMTPIMQAATDVKIIRKWSKPRPEGDDILRIAAKRHGVTVEQVRKRLGEKPPKP